MVVSRSKKVLATLGTWGEVGWILVQNGRPPENSVSAAADPHRRQLASVMKAIADRDVIDEGEKFQVPRR